jgi:hypothetical protein
MRADLGKYSKIGPEDRVCALLVVWDNEASSPEVPDGLRLDQATVNMCLALGVVTTATMPAVHIHDTRRRVVPVT